MLKSLLLDLRVLDYVEFSQFLGMQFHDTVFNPKKTPFHFLAEVVLMALPSFRNMTFLITLPLEFISDNEFNPQFFLR